jgi:large exoprotein involved in heme utilization and adhesion
VIGGSAFPNAKAGDLQLNITDQVSVLSGSIVSNEIPSNARGSVTAGDVVINTQRLIVQNSLVRSDSFSTGNAGNLRVNASQWVELSGEYPRSPADPNNQNAGPGGLFSQVNKNGRGNGGNLLIETPLLRLRDGAKVQTATFGIGPAGTITITANDVEVLETSQPNYYPTAINAGVTRTLQPNLDALGLPTGNAGALTITADRVKVDGGSITVANFGVGEGGNLQITARDRIEVDNRGEISTTTRSGQGGNLFLTANNLLLLRHGGQLNATAGTSESPGNGGNIQLNAPFVIAVPVENSDIVANAFKGRGGNITITTEQLLGLQFRNQLTPDSDITASSDIGLNGTFTLNTPDLDPNRGLVQLPTTPTDPSNRIDQSCASSSSVTRSRFTATGRGGMPSQPDDSLAPSDTLPRLATLPTASVYPGTQTVTTVPTDPIVEAQAALRLPNGKIRFVAQVGHSVPDAFGQAIVGCQSRQPE